MSASGGTPGALCVPSPRACSLRRTMLTRPPASRISMALLLRGIPLHSVPFVSLRTTPFCRSTETVSPSLSKDFAKDGDTVSVDLQKGVVRNETKGTECKGIPLSSKAIEILDAGGLVNIVRRKLHARGEGTHKAPGVPPEADMKQD